MMRDYALVYINGVKHEIKGADLFMQLADYLRYQKGLTGTKVVCAEGDCGACTVLIARSQNVFNGTDKELKYVTMNSCIQFMGLLDGSHVITVEGLGTSEKPHAIQSSMLNCHGAQCGYCTPGFICSIAGMVEDLKRNQQKVSAQKVKNHLTGNLCRCTGYEPIIDSALSLSSDFSLKELAYIKEMYPEKEMLNDFKNHSKLSVYSKSEWRNADDEKVSRVFYLPITMEEACQFKKNHPDVRIVSGATDLGVLANKNKLKIQYKMALVNIAETYKILNDEDFFIVGARASLQALEDAIVNDLSDFSRLLHIFASPQIKYQGTLVGNVANASPIGDTIPFLNVSDSLVVMAREFNGKVEYREVTVNEFIQGYKVLNLKSDEIIYAVKIPKIKDVHYKVYKSSLRKDLDISQVTLGVRYKLNAKNEFLDLELAFGGMSAKVDRVDEIKKLLLTDFSEKSIQESKDVIRKTFKPFSDVRATDEYRLLVAGNLLQKFYDEVKGKGA